MTTKKTEYPFIDWMKALGMFYIVWGHVSSTTNHLTPPILSKQLGVCFIMFVLGFSLARETRPTKQVCFNRAFEIYWFGILCALVISVIQYCRIGRPNATNYLPFLLGVNVVFDHFPANPTTWFIGTYCHALIFWALVLRGVRLRLWMIIGWAAAEILIRSVLMGAAGNFIAYQTLPNWMTILLLGTYFGQQVDGAKPAGGKVALAYLAVLLGLTIVWPALLDRQVAEPRTFPFMSFAVDPYPAGLVAASVAVSFLYGAHTLLIFQITRRLPALSVVKFFGRNTLLIFVAHMPVYYGVNELLQRLGIDNELLLLSTRVLLCWVALALVSEGLNRLVSVKRLRDGLWTWLTGRGEPMRKTSTDLWHVSKTEQRKEQPL